MHTWTGSLLSLSPSEPYFLLDVNPTDPSAASETLETAFVSSSRAHLFRLYPLLLEMSFSRAALPSMWIFPSEHARLFSLPTTNGSAHEPGDPVAQLDARGRWGT